MSGNHIGTTLLTIYDAVAAPDHWPQALDAVARSIGSVGAILIAVDKVGLPFHIQQATSNFSLEDVRHYFNTYGHYDEPVMTSRLAQTPALCLLRDRDVWGETARLDERPDYRFLRERNGIRRRGGVRLSDGKGWTDLLALQFGCDWPDAPPDLPQALGMVLPHLAKAVEISRTFILLRQRYQAALTALDHVEIGMCVARADGSIVVANREARRIHDLDDGLRMSPAGIWHASGGETTAGLARHIRAMASTAAGRGDAREMVMFAPRRSGKRPFMIELAPLCDRLGELEPGLRGAILFMIDPENQRCVSTTKLAQLFLLTKAEAEVCQHMIGGLSALEIADSRNVSEATVRTQFKTIYAKTGVRRRADLLRLAITVDPPIGRNEAYPGDRPPACL